MHRTLYREREDIFILCASEKKTVKKRRKLFGKYFAIKYLTKKCKYLNGIKGYMYIKLYKAVCCKCRLYICKKKKTEKKFIFAYSLRIFEQQFSL